MVDRAFTLLELIIVIAIIAILLGLVLLAVGGVSEAGSRAESANALRQIMGGYISYSNDHRGRLMPGYVGTAEIGTGANQIEIEAELANGYKLAPGDVSPYVWRLLPYIDQEWRLLTTDYRSKAVNAALTNEIAPEDATGAYGPATATAADQIGMALRPSFGLNSIYCGGDSVHGGADAVDFNPWSPSTAGQIIAATRMSEVLNPGRLIVFAPTVDAERNYSDTLKRKYEVEFGYVELRPPFIYDPTSDSFGDVHWTVNAANVAKVATGAPGDAFSNGGGLPIVRWGDDRLPVARMDGSVSVENIQELSQPEDVSGFTDEAKREIMKAWWPFATGYR